MPSSTTPKPDEEKGFNLPREEERVLEFWRTNNIFEKSLKRDGAASAKASASRSKTFVFYEGPPYANGKPGIHHVLARIYKDIILRYKTMRGYFVPRRAGWDTHGLPVEMATEKALGLKSKKDIEKYGIERFNQKAKEEVWIYKDEWEKMTERIGYWLDLKNAYITYEPEYIETLWWTIKQIANRKLLYKGHKVVPWCTRCGTALSSHELALGYKETTDNSVYIKFHLLPNQKFAGGKYATKDKAYILSWTTTPWTLPGNVALAVGKDIEYSAVRIEGAKELLILSADSAEKALKGHSVEVVHKLKGKELVGLEYEPLFDVKSLHSKASYKIYDADFVSTDEGTGVVHTAVMYGEEDYRLGQKTGLPQAHTVNEEGKFTKDVPGLAGLYVKAEETEKKILEQLEKQKNLLKIEKYNHEYPYCWRCETPVLYYARTSWFIEMSKLRPKLLAANKNINWVPEHIKEGRFGEWLREVKDWNLSRERYWGAPLPIWECGKCGVHEVVGSLDELDARAGGSKNKYWTMRHGEAESNILHIIDDSEHKGIKLTPRGERQAALSAKKLGKIDLVIASPIPRAKRTAEIAAGIIGIQKVVFDKRLAEVHLGELEGCHDKRYHELLPTYESKFERKPDKGESLRDLRKRLWEFLADCEKKYKGRNILLVSHEYSIWMLEHAALGWSEKRAIAEKQKRGGDFVGFAEVNPLELKILPRNESGEVDLHRPFADKIELKCKKCAGKMCRVKEVVDVWYDSGAMPFASEGFPFAQSTKRIAHGAEKKNDLRLALRGLPFPADYIAEGMDQTRGWFYTLLAVATALGYEAPYKNVISLGLINDKFGQKMSKSKGNVVDPWAVINKYGADAVRWYLYSINPPGETKNFDESEIQRAFRRYHLMLYNSLIFFETYYIGGTSSDKKASLKNALDAWIAARLNETAASVAKNLDQYQVRDAALALELFVDDLSRWYIRRSRRRFQKPQNAGDHHNASVTLGYVLRELGKLTAPFTPFLAEFIYERLGGKQSIHLESWPGMADGKLRTADRNLLKQMTEVRRLASIALAKRAEAGIKVRQPLSKLKIKNEKLKIPKELLKILAEEVNVKKVVFDEKTKEGVELDTAITPELKEEGNLRELARTVQELRQKAGLKPKDKIVLMLELPEPLRGIASRNEKSLKKEVGARAIEYRRRSRFDAETSTKIDDQGSWLAVRKK